MTALVVDTDYLSTSETARRLGLSASRVRQLAADGRLPSVETPIGRLYPRAVVEDYAAGRLAA